MNPYLLISKSRIDYKYIHDTFTFINPHCIIPVTVNHVEHKIVKLRILSSSHIFLIQDLSDEDSLMIPLLKDNLVLIKLPFNTDSEFFDNGRIIYNRITFKIILKVSELIRGRHSSL